MAPRKKLGQLLIDMGVIDEDQLNSGLSHQKKWGGKIGSALVSQGFCTEADLVRVLAVHLGMPQVSLATAKFDPNALKLVSRQVAEKLQIIPLELSGSGRSETVTMAMAEPTDLALIDQLSFLTGKRIKPLLTGEKEVAEAIARNYGGGSAPAPEVADSPTAPGVAPGATSGAFTGAASQRPRPPHPAPPVMSPAGSSPPEGGSFREAAARRAQPDRPEHRLREEVENGWELVRGPKANAPRESDTLRDMKPIPWSAAITAPPEESTGRVMPASDPVADDWGDDPDDSGSWSAVASPEPAAAFRGERPAAGPLGDGSNLEPADEIPADAIIGTADEIFADFEISQDDLDADEATAIAPPAPAITSSPPAGEIAAEAELDDLWLDEEEVAFASDPGVTSGAQGGEAPEAWGEVADPLAELSKSASAPQEFASEQPAEAPQEDHGVERWALPPEAPQEDRDVQRWALPPEAPQEDRDVQRWALPPEAPQEDLGVERWALPPEAPQEDLGVQRWALPPEAPQEDLGVERWALPPEAATPAADTAEFERHPEGSAVAAFEQEYAYEHAQQEIPANDAQPTSWQPGYGAQLSVQDEHTLAMLGVDPNDSAAALRLLASLLRGLSSRKLIDLHELAAEIETERAAAADSAGVEEYSLYTQAEGHELAAEPQVDEPSEDLG